MTPAYVSCSHKLRRNGGFNVASSDPWPEDSPLVARWRADIYDDHRSTVAILFTNSPSLYSYFIVSDGPDRYELAVDQFAKRLAVDMLQFCRTTALTIGGVEITGIASGSLIASMNNMMRVVDFLLSRDRDVEDALNNAPYEPIDWQFPKEAWRDLLVAHFDRGS